MDFEAASSYAVLRPMLRRQSQQLACIDAAMMLPDFRRILRALNFNSIGRRRRCSMHNFAAATKFYKSFSLSLHDFAAPLLSR